MKFRSIKTKALQAGHIGHAFVAFVPAVPCHRAHFQWTPVFLIHKTCVAWLLWVFRNHAFAQVGKKAGAICCRENVDSTRYPAQDFYQKKPNQQILPCKARSLVLCLISCCAFLATLLRPCPHNGSGTLSTNKICRSDCRRRFAPNNAKSATACFCWKVPNASWASRSVCERHSHSPGEWHRH